MAQKLDELLADNSRRSGPRLTLPYILIVSGVILAVIGLMCSSAPGGVLVLVGLTRVETQRRRIDSGALPESERPTVDMALRVAYVSMAIVIVMFIVQTALLCMGVYQPLWGQAFYTLRSLLGISG